ncbi:MAG: ParB N-terminal domain-containing protein [Desulfomonilaceae bacterium]
MNSRINTKTVNINLTQIDLKNIDFLVPSFESLDSLIASIEQVGVLYPPVVKGINDANFIPVLGRRRIEALKALRTSDLEVGIINPSQPDHETYTMAFWDNLARIKGDAAVRAFVVKRFLELAPKEILVKRIFPFINVPPKGPQLEKIKNIGRLELTILEALSNGRIHEKSALIVAALPADQRQILLKLIYDLGLNSNKAFEVISHLNDLSIYRNESITDLLERSEVLRILHDSNITVSEKALQFRSLIKQWAFPDFTNDQEVFNKWLKGVGPPKNVTVRPAQSFEDESVTIEIRLDSFSKAKNFVNLIRKFQLDNHME